jgi:hypothetical protein
MTVFRSMLSLLAGILLRPLESHAPTASDR